MAFSRDLLPDEPQYVSVKVVAVTPSGGVLFFPQIQKLERLSVGVPAAGRSELVSSVQDRDVRVRAIGVVQKGASKDIC